MGLGISWFDLVTQPEISRGGHGMIYGVLLCSFQPDRDLVSCLPWSCKVYSGIWRSPPTCYQVFLELSALLTCGLVPSPRRGYLQRLRCTMLDVSLSAEEMVVLTRFFFSVFFSFQVLASFFSRSRAAFCEFFWLELYRLFCSRLLLSYFGL